MFPYSKNWCAVPPKIRFQSRNEPSGIMDSFTNQDIAIDLLDICRKKGIDTQSYPSNVFASDFFHAVANPKNLDEVLEEVGIESAADDCEVVKGLCEGEMAPIKTNSYQSSLRCATFTPDPLFKVDCPVNYENICRRSGGGSVSDNSMFDERTLDFKDSSRQSHENTESVQGMSGSGSKVNNVAKNKPKCAKCRNHGIITNLAGHKGSCPFARCNCNHCSLVDERRMLNSYASEFKFGRRLTKNTAVVRPIAVKGKNMNFFAQQTSIISRQNFKSF